MSNIIMNGKTVKMLDSEVHALLNAYREFHQIAQHEHIEKDIAVKRLETLLDELEVLTASIERYYKQGLNSQIIRLKIKELHNRAHPIEQEISQLASGIATHYGSKYHPEISQFTKEFHVVAARVNQWLDRVRNEIAEIESGKYTLDSHGTIEVDFYGKPIVKGGPVARYAVLKISDL